MTHDQHFAQVFSFPPVTGLSQELDAEAHQRWVDSMGALCRCRSSNCPCDGVLAGGICDDLQDEPDFEPNREMDDDGDPSPP